jgi:hypothetical protein
MWLSLDCFVAALPRNDSALIRSSIIALWAGIEFDLLPRKMAAKRSMKGCRRMRRRFSA